MFRVGSGSGSFFKRFGLRSSILYSPAPVPLNAPLSLQVGLYCLRCMKSLIMIDTRVYKAAAAAYITFVMIRIHLHSSIQYMYIGTYTLHNYSHQKSHRQALSFKYVVQFSKIFRNIFFSVSLSVTYCRRKEKGFLQCIHASISIYSPYVDLFMRNKISDKRQDKNALLHYTEHKINFFSLMYDLNCKGGHQKCYSDTSFLPFYS